MCCGLDRISDDWQWSQVCADFFPLLIQQSPSPESVPGSAVAELPAMKGDSLALEQLQLAGGRAGKQGRPPPWKEIRKREIRRRRDVKYEMFPLLLKLRSVSRFHKATPRRVLRTETDRGARKLLAASFSVLVNLPCITPRKPDTSFTDWKSYSFHFLVHLN